MGPKKKRKPVANPARGFATTSVASKPKPDTHSDTAQTSTNTSKIDTPVTIDSQTPPQVTVNGGKPQDDADTHVPELHQLTPEQLEQRLEDADLQQFIEEHSAKVHRESSRHANKLQTDCRLLQAQAQALQSRYLLPQQKLSTLLRLINEDLSAGRYQYEQGARRSDTQGDDLVAELWALDKTLNALGFSQDQADRALKHTLRFPRLTETDPQGWGLERSLEWLAITDAEQDLPVFDAHTGRAIDFNAQNQEQGKSIFQSYFF